MIISANFSKKYSKASKPNNYYDASVTCHMCQKYN